MDTTINPDMEKQLQLKAVINSAATVSPRPGNTCSVSLPFRQDGWRKAVSFLFRFPTEKVFEFDEMGTEILQWCDGKTTFETMIDRYRKRWKLSFFEARGLLMSFFSPLLKNNIVIFIN